MHGKLLSALLRFLFIFYQGYIIYNGYTIPWLNDLMSIPYKILKIGYFANIIMINPS